MNDVLAIAKNYIAYLGQVGIPISTAYLYGSYAKGKPRTDSDIDICVVSPSFAGKDLFDEMIKLNQLGLKIDSRIETVPYTPDDLNDKYSSLANEIRNTGIQIEV
jgi:hypothetical protein